MSTAASRNCCFMPSQSWLTTSQLTMGACPSAAVKPFAARPVLLSYTNEAPTVIKTPRIMPNKNCVPYEVAKHARGRASHWSGGKLDYVEISTESAFRQ